MSKSDHISPAWPMHGAMFAHGAVSHARTMGRLPPPSDYSCADCGKQAVHYDHRDYNKPLDLTPVCSSCNGRRGAAIPLTAPLRTSECLVETAGEVKKAVIESRDFYPKPSDKRDIRILTADGELMIPSPKREFERR